MDANRSRSSRRRWLEGRIRPTRRRPTPRARYPCPNRLGARNRLIRRLRELIRISPKPGPWWD